MGLLRESRPETVGVALPADARWLGVWVNPVNMPSEFSLQFEVVDSTGRYFSYLLGPDIVRADAPGLEPAGLGPGPPGNLLRGAPALQPPAFVPVAPTDPTPSRTRRDR